MNIYDPRYGIPPTGIDQNIEIGDEVTIVAPPVPRVGGWFAHPYVGYSGVVVDYQWRYYNTPMGREAKDPHGRVIELKSGDVRGRRVVVFDDRELRKGRM
jgi:ribosomal protein L21E